MFRWLAYLFGYRYYVWFDPDLTRHEAYLRRAPAGRLIATAEAVQAANMATLPTLCFRTADGAQLALYHAQNPVREFLWWEGVWSLGVPVGWSLKRRTSRTPPDLRFQYTGEAPPSRQNGLEHFWFLDEVTATDALRQFLESRLRWVESQASPQEQRLLHYDKRLEGELPTEQREFFEEQLRLLTESLRPLRNEREAIRRLLNPER